jgi:hypothetical protein
MINYSPTLHKKHLQAYEIGNIYALDCLLYNVDRGRRVTKPNILMDDERMLLIDHEQCLHFADGQDEHFKMILEGYKNFQLDYPYQHHLFYSELKNLRASQKLHLFDEFCEYLTHLNTSDFRSTAVSLGNLGVWTGNHVRIYEYLCFLKGNVTAFQKALLTSIS